MKQGIIIVNKGTMDKEVRRRCIEDFMFSVGDRIPDADMVCVYTDDGIRKRLREETGEKYQNLKAAILSMKDRGVTDLIVVPTEIHDGPEFKKMKEEVFNENYNEGIALEVQTDVEDYVNEEELLALEQEQQMIDMMEEQALLEQSEEQAMIDVYIEQQLMEQSLLDQADEEAQIDSEDQQQFNEPIITVLKVKQQEYINNEELEDEEDDEPENNVPHNLVAHCQVLELMRQRNHLDIYVKKEEIMISSFGITRLKYKLNDNGWQWILNYLETACYEDYGVDPLKVADIDCESRIKELIERGGKNIARVPSETYIEICAFYRYGKLYFSIRRNDEFMNYLIEKGL